MVDIQSPTAEIRQGKEKKKKDRRNHRMKILHRATINREAATTKHYFLKAYVV